MLSDNAQEWLQVIKDGPSDWDEGILAHALDVDGLDGDEQEYLIKVLRSLLRPSL